MMALLDCGTFFAETEVHELLDGPCVHCGQEIEVHGSAYGWPCLDGSGNRFERATEAKDGR